MSGEVVAVGGTFDPVHDGHRSLLEAAFARGQVTIGLTSDALARSTRPEERPIRPFVDRMRDLTEEVRVFAKEYDRTFEIRRLHEPTGIADAPQFDTLVVSPETKPAGERINEIRASRGHDPLEIVIVDHVIADDGDIITSSRILAGEIDEHGAVVGDP